MELDELKSPNQDQIEGSVYKPDLLAAGFRQPFELVFTPVKGELSHRPP